MIEFEGMPSGELRKHIIKENKKIGWIGCALGGIVLLVALVYVAIKLRHPAVLLGFLGLALWILLFALQPFKKDIPKLFATKLTILEDGTMVAVVYNETHCNSAKSVKKVLDVGNGYSFVFDYQNRSSYFHCQKDQLTKGSIEQFEELFKDKIVRLGEDRQI